MDSLIVNSFIFLIFKILLDMNANLKIKIYAIKCLLMLLTRKLAIPIVSVLHKNFIYKFNQFLIKIINVENSKHLMRSFLIYSLTLIFKLNPFSNIQSTNNITIFPTNKDFSIQNNELKSLRKMGNFYFIFIRN
ncbi:hypothetical protein MXB_1723 [Myxobolus squamalis]|nr:hypothetical protein MXB_1723 [Myxobolus squamalis]